METIYRKGLFSIGSCLFPAFIVLFVYLWRLKDWLFKAAGRIFFAGNGAHFYKCDFLFPNLFAILTHGNSLSTAFAAFVSDSGILCLDLGLQAKLALIVATKKTALYQWRKSD